MKTVKKLQRPPPKRALTYSTSQGRANFAKALETTQLKNAIIGFDRYGQLVAALAPIDAIRILAGRGAEVEPAVRDKIERLARLFLHNVPKPELADSRPAKSARKTAAPSKQKPKRRV